MGDVSISWAFMLVDHAWKFNVFDENSVLPEREVPSQKPYHTSDLGMVTLELKSFA